MNKSMLCILGSLSALSARAATLVMTAEGDGEAPRSFYTANGWSDGQPPHEGNDYVVANGLTMSVGASGVDTSTYVFGGDSLKIGVAGQTYGKLWQFGYTTIEIDRLILSNGEYYQWSSDASKAKTVQGNAIVWSPSSAPFRISCGSTYSLEWRSVLTGDEGTGLCWYDYGSGKASTINLRSHNPDYFGSHVVRGDKMMFAISWRDAFGGPLKELDPVSVTFQSNVVFKCRNKGEVLAKTDNRGICVGAGGMKIDVDGQWEGFRIDWPFCGTETVSKINSGDLTLGGSWNTAGDRHEQDLEVRVGTVTFAEGFANGTENEIRVVQSGNVSVMAGETVAVANLSFAGGGILVRYDKANDRTGVLVLDKDFTHEGPVPVSFDVRPAVGKRYPFAKMPVAAGVLKQSDFLGVLGSESCGSPSTCVTIEQEGDFFVAYAEAPATVEVVAVDSNNRVYADDHPEYWSDGKPVHGRTDYLVEAKTAKRTVVMNPLDVVDQKYQGDYTFPGNALTLIGSSSAVAQLFLRQKSLTVDLRTGDKTKVWIGGYLTPCDSAFNASSGETQTMRGRIFVDNQYSTWKSDSGLDFRIGMARTLRVESSVCGSGAVVLQQADANAGTYEFVGDNAGYTGCLWVYNGVTFRFDSPRCLGNPSAERTEGLQVQASSRLYPIGSVRLDFSNRNVRFYGSTNSVKVDPEEELEIASKVRFAAGTASTDVMALTKLGTGSFAVSGSVVVEQAGKVPELKVQEGFVRAGGDGRALTACKLTISDGAGISARLAVGETGDAATYGTIVADAGRLSVSGTTLPISVRVPEKVRSGTEVPFLTVPSAVADTLQGKLTLDVLGADGMNASIVRKDVTVDDSAAVTFAARFDRGMAIIVR